ncbi:hypothetical protein pipiens_005802 [Culex pipiens pipiens]|uniref:Protein PDF n=3 Tax=Culex pipiens TaxID=7175 RepID=A0A8D8NZW4_CULPI|nr:protein PDF [Culex pipiens pallens]
MVNVSGICFVLFCLCLRVSIAMPSYDDENRLAVDKEAYIRQLAEWLANQSASSLVASNDIYSLPPCRPCFYPSYQTESAGGPAATMSHNPYSKRNSELINSLLSLPKDMNNAGK